MTPWPETVKEARELQNRLKKKVRLHPLGKPPKHIAACDAAFKDDEVIGAVCLYRYPEIEFIETVTAVMKCRFPYVPGYLSFREGPVLIEAIGKLKTKPDLFIFDGQGIAHPRGFGLATHMGVLLRRPGIGCAKSRLTGEFGEPGRARGRWSPLTIDGKAVGAVLRTKDNVRPLFVSPGHMIDIEGSVEIILRCLTRYRIPEPQRCADREAGILKKVLQ